MKLINNVLFMLLTVGMFSGCIKEDMDDCPKYSVNTLSLSYMPYWTQTGYRP